MNGTILENYKRRVEEDRANQNNELPQNMVNEMPMSKEDKLEYDRELKRLREDPLDMEAAYRKKMEEIHTYSEEDLINNSCLTNEDVTEIKVLHAYCPNCGKELVSMGPPCFNPFTMQKQCIHHCECGEKYNLEYAYPRFALYNAEGEEIKAYGL